MWGMELNFIMHKEQLRNYLESCAGMKKWASVCEKRRRKRERCKLLGGRSALYLQPGAVWDQLPAECGKWKSPQPNQAGLFTHSPKGLVKLHKKNSLLFSLAAAAIWFSEEKQQHREDLQTIHSRMSFLEENAKCFFSQQEPGSVPIQSRSP